jgi:heat shock protein HslJ
VEIVEDTMQQQTDPAGPVDRGGRGSGRRRWAVMALAVGLVPLWSTAAAARTPVEPPPPAQQCKTIDFEKATVESIPSTSTSPRHRLTVSGTVPYASTQVRLVPLVYIMQPEFWGIEVTGCQAEIGIPQVGHFSVTYDFTGTLGTRGIEVIGATRSQKFDLTGRPQANPLANTNWVLDPASLGVPVPAGRSITAQFSDTSVGGSSACNLYNGPYQTAPGNRIKFGDFITTKIACTPDTAAAESTYLRKLKAATSYRIIWGQLILSGPAGSLRFRSAPAPATSPVGSWQVTGYFAGTPGAIVPLIANTSITLDIRSDGTLVGKACNSYGAQWKADSSSFGIGGFNTTLMLCSEPAGVSEQEGKYYAALQSAASWRVEGTRLVLADAAGRDVVTADAVKA